MYPILFHFGQFVLPSYGVLAALALIATLGVATRRAQRLGLNGVAVWNLVVVVLFTGLVASRLLLAVLNFHDLLAHPAWFLSLAMIHDSFIQMAGAACAVLAGVICARVSRLPLLATLDALAPALTVGHAFLLVGAFLSGAGYGTPTQMPWGVVYTSRLAALWSGTPRFLPLHPVQLYEAGAELLILVVLLAGGARLLRRPGQSFAVWLYLEGLAHFLCEMFRADDGRYPLLNGAVTVTQLLCVAMVVASGLLLLHPTEPAGANLQNAVE